MNFLYRFFDYKYNIEGYKGQDFYGPYRYIYMGFCLIVALCILLFTRKLKHKYVDVYMKIVSVFMIVMEVVKISWESYWDIKTGRGFNAGGILPLYTCSCYMYTFILAAYSKGKVKECCIDWMVTIGLVAGLSNVFFIQGLRWYPFWTFGAFYSMSFHFLMVATSCLLIATRYKEYKWIDIIKGFIPHLIFSAIVIPLDYIKNWDYMQYPNASGIPFLEDLGSSLIKSGKGYICCIMMVFLYLLMVVLFISIYIGVYKLSDTISKNKQPKTEENENVSNTKCTESV